MPKQKRVGIDVGGSYIKVIFPTKSKSYLRKTITTPKTPSDFFSSLAQLKNSVTTQSLNLGIAYPGKVNNRAGTIYSPTGKLSFLNNVNLRKQLKKIGFSNITFSNDAHAFTKYHLLKGHGFKINNFLCFTLGTAIGMGIVINGKLYFGSNKCAGEPGFLFNKDVKDFKKLWTSALKFKKFGKLNSELGKRIARIVDMFDPELIIFGGGIIQHHSSALMPGLKKHIAKNLILPTNMPRIRTCKTKYAGAIGASLFRT